MDIAARIAAELAKPKTHRVITGYADRCKFHDTRSAAQAENYAIGERRKINRALLDRDTGEYVHVQFVTVVAL